MSVDILINLTPLAGSTGLKDSSSATSELDVEYSAFQPVGSCRVPG